MVRLQQYGSVCAHTHTHMLSMVSDWLDYYVLKTHRSRCASIARWRSGVDDVYRHSLLSLLPGPHEHAWMKCASSPLAYAIEHTQKNGIYQLICVAHVNCEHCVCAAAAAAASVAIKPPLTWHHTNLHMRMRTLGKACRDAPRLRKPAKCAQWNLRAAVLNRSCGPRRL